MKLPSDSALRCHQSEFSHCGNPALDGKREKYIPLTASR